MAGVVETSWSLGDIDRAAKEMSTPKDPILAGAMEAQMPRGDYWAGLCNPKSTWHMRPQAGRARLSAHGRARGLVRRYGPGHAPDLENLEIWWAFLCAGTRNNAWIRILPSGHSRARRLVKMY